MATEPTVDQLLQERKRNAVAYEDSTAAITRTASGNQEQKLQIESGKKAFFADNPPFLTVTPVPAQPLEEEEVRTESRSERKKREAMENQYKKALSAQDKSDAAEGEAQDLRFRRAFEEISKEDNKNLQKMENTILSNKLAAINEQEKADLASVEYMKSRMKYDPNAANIDPKNSVEAQTLDIRYKAQLARAEAYHTRADQYPLGTKERAKMMEKYEEELLKADHLHREQKVAAMPAGKEKDRDADTIKRHDKFDFLKKIFRKSNKYSKADTQLEIKSDIRVGIGEDLKLVNIGRATMGGTKPMYNFVDNNHGEPQIWLYKEATNCIGMAKPEGAVVTEAASRLQKKVRGDYSIPAKCVRNEQGKVIGSIQKKITPAQTNVNLFKWQANPDNSLPAETVSDLMKEHILDWTLCNFDTKGENFLMQEGGHIISFDKEASFNHLLDKDAQKISYTYKPHSNDTIYNTMFKGFINGDVKLDFFAAEEAIDKISAINDADFLKMFEETLEVKYGSDSAQRKAAEAALLNRKRNLKEDVRRFYTDLINERIEVIKDNNSPEALQETNYLYMLLTQNTEQVHNDDKENMFSFRSENRYLKNRDMLNEALRTATDPKMIEHYQSDLKNLEYVMMNDVIYAMKHPYVPRNPDDISGPL